METLFDFAQPLEAVMRRERVYPTPLKARHYVELFRDWVEINRAAVEVMDAHAIDVHDRRGKVGAQYIYEWARWDAGLTFTKVPWTDQYGQQHVYGLNNSTAALYGRRLSIKYRLKVETRKSMFDGLPASELRGCCV